MSSTERSPEVERVVLAIERTELASERNRLANERTFLAWIRTGLASVGGGIAIIRLLAYHELVHKILANVVGIFLILVGIAMFILSLADYWTNYKKLKAPVGYASSIYTVATIVAILVLSTLLLTLLALIL